MSKRFDQVDLLMERARKEPIGVDLSDFGDEYVQGFLAGQASILEELNREPECYGIRIRAYHEE